MIILPTLRRPDRLKTFIQSYRNTQATLPIHVVFDKENISQYDEIQLPAHWKKCCAPAGTPIGDIFNLLFRKFPNEPYYGMVADDVVPETLIWDIVLRDSCMPDKIAWGCDGIQNEKLPTHPFIGGDLVRKLGWWSLPGLRHWYVDNVWKILADEFNIGIYLPQIKMTHYHPMNGKRQRDRTDEQQPNNHDDEIIFRDFLNFDLIKLKERFKNDAIGTDIRSIRSEVDNRECPESR